MKLCYNYGYLIIIKQYLNCQDVVTSNHYFDKNKLIIDCTDVLNNYTNRVKPIELLSDIHLYDTVFTYLIYRLI